MRNHRTRDRGSALLIAVVITIMVVGISGAFISHSMIRQKASMNAMFEAKAITAAEAGATLYVQDLNKSYWLPKAGITFAPPAPYRHGFLGSDLTVNSSQTLRTTAWTDQAFYRVWFENLGANGVDDNNNGTIDDTAEQNYRRLWVEGFAGGTATVNSPTSASYTGGVKRVLEVILSHVDGGVFYNAIFAGNSSADSSYIMQFGGSSTAQGKDQVLGNIYSGGGISVGTGDAALLNETGSGPGTQVMYNTTKSDSSSAADPTYIQGTQPIPDIAAANYPTKAAVGSPDLWSSSNPTGQYVNVDYELTTKGTVGTTLADGSQTDMGNGRQITNVNEPAHIFRKEPTTSTGTTQKRVQGYSGMNPDKANFFLEDPTKTANNGGTPTSPWGASTGNTGLRVEVTPVTNNKVYYIDGNLWASNGPAYTFQWLNNAGADMKITIVVKGNVYLTDNVMYDQLAKAAGRNDALAIIAINDPAYPSVSATDISNPSSPAYNFNGMASGTAQQKIDAARDYNKLHGSGNIFFGDPGGGTTERFESFLYAQNNFYDNNLGGSGTLQTNIYGNMTAGNQIQINRNTGAGVWKPLLVTFDNRLKTGAVNLPGLPQNPTSSGTSWSFASWRQVPSRPKDWAGFTFSPP